MGLSNKQLVSSLVMVVVGMVMLSFAAVPLYNLFCQVTGFGGTTQVAESLPDRVYERSFTVQFNADVMPGLDWEFEPMQRNMQVKVGEQAMAFYRAKNTGGSGTTGTSTFNVTPHQAGQYFAKIECFCFEEQPLKPGEEIEMPVSFFLDPELLNDDELDGHTTITLSYTFFPLQKPAE